MGKTLVIVESPTKAKTISKFLGKDYIVTSSFGHIRDLPKKEMGVDIENDFRPTYEIPQKAKAQLKKLKDNVAKCDEVILATDEDREGEAIAWHLLDALKLKKANPKRIVFHEITKKAIEHALAHPRELNMDLVDAQQARRILDRLVGYELSPLLWKKIARGLSAGRVQSAAVRLIVAREMERRAFKQDEYWTIDASLSKKDDETLFGSTLSKIDGKPLKKLSIQTAPDAQKIVDDLTDATFVVESIEKKEAKKAAKPPFTTSTLQQTASHQLGFSAKQTMMLAQQLYEGIEMDNKETVGLITYMRTDSLFMAKEAVDQCRTYVAQTLGENYIPSSPIIYTGKSKLAQEAHEAIRPTDITRTPESVKAFLAPRQLKLYTLIWQRAIASQMQPAILDKTTVLISAKNYTFKTTGQTIRFDGYLRLFPEKTKENMLPVLDEKEALVRHEITPVQHFTEPPARYSEATLIKALEEHGIGRPSTYAPTMSTIQDRKYVEKDENKKLFPTEVGETVDKLLVKHFPKIVDLEFTAKMEEDLDEIANGKAKWVPVIEEFYTPFKANLVEKEKSIDKKEFTEQATDMVCEKCGNPMIIKLGRYGKFYACSNYPECKTTKPMETEKAEETEHHHTIEPCEKCGSKMILKHGRFGKFWACSNYPECKNIRSHVVKTGIKCPTCNEGDVVQKKSKTKRIFFGCSRYPECDFVSWGKPIDKKCPQCGKIMVEAGKAGIKCIDKECGYKE